MNIVEKEANSFVEDFYDGPEINNLGNLKSKLTMKLYDFNRDRDKLDFLKTVRQGTIAQKDKHMEKCKKLDCAFVQGRDLGLFVVDQEIDDVNRLYTFEAQDTDKFTSQEESNLHSKLNDIADQLHKQGLGQEIIFDEIESLKNHFNLGKKTWFQLVKGKIIDLTIDKALDGPIGKEIYSKLSDGFTEVVKQLN
jgi:hypothetical protein